MSCQLQCLFWHGWCTSIEKHHVSSQPSLSEMGGLYLALVEDISITDGELDHPLEFVSDVLKRRQQKVWTSETLCMDVLWSSQTMSVSRAILR